MTGPMHEKRMDGGSPQTFTYRALRADGTLLTGSLTVASEAGARALLSAQRLFPLEVHEESKAFRWSRTRRMSIGDLSLGLRAMASLMESGLPMTRVLSAFEELAPESWKRALPILRQSMREGTGLAAALDAAPVAMPAVMTAIIRGGEAGAGQAAAVRRAADLAERTAARAGAIRAALAYPVILAFAGCISLVLLIGVVLPRFASILTDLGQALPPTTRAILALGGLMHVLTLPALVLGAAVIAGWHWWTSTPLGRERWHALLLAVPVLGAIRRAGATGRACEALASLLDSGVPLATALKHAAHAAGDLAIECRLLAARASVIHGERLSSAWQAADAATPTVTRLARAGEETGRLADLLHHAGRIESEHEEAAMRRAIGMLEPAFILTFGGFVALVAAALLQAIYTIKPTG